MSNMHIYIYVYVCLPPAVPCLIVANNARLPSTRVALRTGSVPVLG